MTHASTASFPRHPRLRSFARRFGRAHLDFACHAAFPLALTPDLLYLLWAAFPRDARDQPIGTPWVAVADLLLSSLCDEVGHELFEFEPEVRDELLAELKSSPRFGPARFAALAAFVSEYVGQQLRSSDPFVRDFAEAQHWAARSATDPAGAAAKLARAYAELRGTERDRLLRLEAIIEAIARPERASDIESLLPYARALADWARGDQARAATVLRSMANSTGQIFLGELVLPLPPAIAAPASDVISTAGPGGPVQQAIPVPSANNEELAELRRQMEEAQAIYEQTLPLATENTDLALERFGQALALFRLVGDRLGEANVLKSQGDVQKFRKEMDAALASYEAALALFRAMGNRLGEANVLKSQGDVQKFRKEMDAALASYEAALALFRAVGDRLGEANVLKALGDLLQFRDERDAALDSYQQALALFRAVGDRLGEANVLKALGDLLQFRDEYDAALASYEAALGLYRAVGDRLGEANVLAAHSRLVIDDDPPRSQELLEAALALRHAIGDAYSEAADLGNYGIALLQRGRNAEALPFLQRARALFAAHGFANLVAQMDTIIVSSAEYEEIPQIQTDSGTRAMLTRPLISSEHPQLEQQRADILRRLEQLEQRSHRTPEPTPQSEIEAADLRRQLSEIDEQLAALPAEAGAQQTAPDIEVSPDEAPLTNISLHIARQGSGYSISLVSGTSIMQATLAPSEAQLEELAGLARRRLDEVVKTQVDGQLVYQSPQATIAPEVHAQSLRALAEAGSFMHQQLFFRPDSGRDSHVLGNRLRELSQRARLRITIISERLFLPWALLYDREIIEPGNIDAEGFWGFKHVIECQLPSTAPQQSAVLSFEDVVGEASPIIVPGGQLELGFVGDNAVDAQFSQPIVVQQRASMSSLPRVHVQDYSSASDFYRLLSDGIAAADIVYMYCLMDRNSDTGTGDVRIRLGDQDISLRELRARLPVTPLPGRPFVFMNAERVLNADLTQIDSFVPYFLQRGARAVLGGEASLPAFFAAQFGVEFVSRFVAGEQSAGNLLLALRRAYLTQRNNLLGLIYTLYGHADTQVEWDEPEAEQEIPRPARKGERPATKRAPGSAAALPASILEQLREQLNDLLTELEASNDLPLRDAENLHAHLELAIQAAEQDVPNRQQILDKLSAMGKITRSLRSRYDSARILDQQISSAQRSAKDLTSTPPTSFA